MGRDSPRLGLGRGAGDRQLTLDRRAYKKKGGGTAPPLSATNVAYRFLAAFFVAFFAGFFAIDLFPPFYVG